MQTPPTNTPTPPTIPPATSTNVEKSPPAPIFDDSYKAIVVEGDITIIDETPRPTNTAAAEKKEEADASSVKSEEGVERKAQVLNKFEFRGDAITMAKDGVDNIDLFVHRNHRAMATLLRGGAATPQVVHDIIKLSCRHIYDIVDDSTLGFLDFTYYWARPRFTDSPLGRARVSIAVIDVKEVQKLERLAELLHKAVLNEVRKQEGLLEALPYWRPTLFAHIHLHDTAITASKLHSQAKPIRPVFRRPVSPLGEGQRQQYRSIAIKTDTTATAAATATATSTAGGERKEDQQQQQQQQQRPAPPIPHKV